MKSFLMALGFVIAATSQVQAAKLAVYQGPIYNDIRGNFLVGEGQWTQVTKECAGFIQSAASRGFMAADSAKRFSGITQCKKALVTLDLDRSSFCQNQGGMEIYYSPKIVSIQCM